MTKIRSRIWDQIVWEVYDSGPMAFIIGLVALVAYLAFVFYG